MPQLDDAGQRLLLSSLQVRVLGDLADGRGPQDDATRAAARALRDAGLLDASGALCPLAADFARCAGRPAVRLVVEVVGPQGGSVADVVVAGHDAGTVWFDEPWPGGPADAERVHRRAPLHTLLWDLGRLVALRPGRAAEAAPVTTDVGTVEGVLTLLADADPGTWDEVRALALADAPARLAHLPHETLVRWTTLLAGLRASWRVTAFWGDPHSDGPEAVVRGLAVLDAGEQGYWVRTSPQEPLRPEDLQPATPLVLEPWSAAQVWRALAALLPTAAELRAVAPVGAPA